MAWFSPLTQVLHGMGVLQLTRLSDQPGKALGALAVLGLIHLLSNVLRKRPGSKNTQAELEA